MTHWIFHMKVVSTQKHLYQNMFGLTFTPKMVNDFSKKILRLTLPPPNFCKGLLHHNYILGDVCTTNLLHMKFPLKIYVKWNLHQIFISNEACTNHLIQVLFASIIYIEWRLQIFLAWPLHQKNISSDFSTKLRFDWRLHEKNQQGLHRNILPMTFALKIQFNWRLHYKTTTDDISTKNQFWDNLYKNQILNKNYTKFNSNNILIKTMVAPRTNTSDVPPPNF